MDLDKFLDQIEKEYPSILNDIVRSTVAREAGWINDCGRSVQLKYLFKETATFTEEELI